MPTDSDMATFRWPMPKDHLPSVWQAHREAYHLTFPNEGT